MTKKDLGQILKAQQGELDAVIMYQHLAKKVSEKDAKVFKALALEEGQHANVFKKISKVVLKPKKGKAIVVGMLYHLLGRERLYKLIAKGEYAAAKKYEALIEKFPTVASVRDDEMRHGDSVSALLKEKFN